VTTRPWWPRPYDATLNVIESVGYDRHYGRTLLRRLERSGLETTGCEGRCYVVRGGSPGTAFDLFSFLAQREALLGSEALTERELEEALRYIDDPAATFSRL
jgi:hypothetical protein